MSGDTYVDHPSFAAALLDARAGGRGLPRRGAAAAGLAFVRAVAAVRPAAAVLRRRAGNMDSLINHYTANKKVRNDDAYSPGGRIGLRPDRATLPYCHRARGLPRRAGDRRRRRSVAAPAGPLRLLERHGSPFHPARLQSRPPRLRHGRRDDRGDRRAWPRGGRCATCANMRGVAYVLGAREAQLAASGGRKPPDSPATSGGLRPPLAEDASSFPPTKQVRLRRLRLRRVTRVIRRNTNPTTRSPGAIPQPRGRRA